MKEYLKVVASCRPTMYLSFNRIFVTSTYLTVTSDECLQSAIWHEYGHIKQRKTMIAIILVSLAIATLSMLILEIEAFLFLAVGFYIWCCYVSRLGEYKSDEYALKHSSITRMYEMLSGEGSRLDTRLAQCFYLLRWHPSTKKRLHNLGL